MSYTDIDTRMYYPEDYDYAIYYQNELKKYQTPIYKPSPLDPKKKKPVVFPTINYLNERKCPIYVHHIRKDSSIYNHYNEKLVIPRKPVEPPKSTPPNASKFVLDKLEETYWATWKPKKENESGIGLKSPRKFANLGFSDSKPVFQEHNKVPRKAFNRPHGDVNDNDNVIKYFKARRFDSSSTTDSVAQEANQKKTKQKDSPSNEIVASESIENRRSIRLERPSNSRRIKATKQDPISQEIQTEVHCPVILEESKENDKEPKGNVDLEHNEQNSEENTNKIDEWNRRNSEDKVKPGKSPKAKGKGKKKSKEGKQTKKEKDIKKPDMPLIIETDDNSDSMNTFVEHKDSIEITKRKQENSGPKEYLQQPKCIRLFRKSGLTAGYIKGGTYPLKSCLKKDTSPKGNFRLGAPGSPLFVTTSSFSSKRRK